MTIQATQARIRVPRRAIAQYVCRAFDVEFSALGGPSRSKKLVHARFAAAHLMQAISGCSHPQIGETLERDRTSIVNAVQGAEKLLVSDDDFSVRYAMAKQHCIAMGLRLSGIAPRTAISTGAAPQLPPDLKKAPAVNCGLPVRAPHRDDDSPEDRIMRDAIQGVTDRFAFLLAGERPR